MLRALAPDGPLVLVGHSMGGMTIMALAEQQPDLFAERVLGVALPRHVRGRGRGPRAARHVPVAAQPAHPRARPASPAGSRCSSRAPGGVGHDLIWALTRRFSYGDRRIDPARVDLVDSMISANAVDALTDFVDTLGTHDRVAALPALAGCEVLVAAGDADALIPFRHSEVIAAELSGATLVRLPGVGHLPMLEQPEVIDAALADLIARCAGAPAHLAARMSPLPAGPVALDTPLELPDTADTEALGERLAADLRAGDLLVLSGPLGAGKTALVRGLARGLGVAGPITSPTFVIAREHRPLPGGAGVPLVHVDAYRLGTAGDVAAELDDLDLDTDLAGAVVAVEWGEGVAERLSARHLLVRLERRPDDVRIARVHRVEEAGAHP